MDISLQISLSLKKNSSGIYKFFVYEWWRMEEKSAKVGALSAVMKELLWSAMVKKEL